MPADRRGDQIRPRCDFPMVGGERGFTMKCPSKRGEALKIVIILIIAAALVFAVGCGSPKTATNPGNSAPRLPQIGGTWTGTTNLQGSTPNLTSVLTEDSAGNLTGTAGSTEGCNFSLPVTGVIYTNCTFSVQAANPTSLMLAGSMANNNVDARGSVTLGSGTRCSK